MTKMSFSEVRKEFAEAINQVKYKGDRIVIQRKGKDVAVLVSLEDLELLERIEDKLDEKLIEEAWKEQGDEPLAKWEDVEKELSKSD